MGWKVRILAALMLASLWRRFLIRLVLSSGEWGNINIKGKNYPILTSMGIDTHIIICNLFMGHSF